MRLELVGYKRFTSKQGKDYCVANVVSDYSLAETNKGCVGMKVQEIFIPDEQYGYLNNEHIGHELKLTYGLGDYGKPRVTSVEIV